MRRISAAVVATCLILAMSVSVFAGTFTRDDAINKALKNAGYTKSEVDWLRAERDDGCIEVEFYVRSTGDKYDYEFSASNGKMREKSVDIAHTFNSSSKKIGKSKAIGIVAKAAGVKKSVVKSGICRYKRDDGEWIYKFKFWNGRKQYEYELLAPTGQIIEYSIDY